MGAAWQLISRYIYHSARKQMNTLRFYGIQDSRNFQCARQATSFPQEKTELLWSHWLPDYLTKYEEYSPFAAADSRSTGK
jgi:hypothetical protein